MFENSKAEIRKISKDAGLYDWQVAELLGITPNRYSEKLRHKLSNAEFNRIKRVIEKYAQSQQERTEQHA